MVEPPNSPRWQALQIGPGGMPADQVRPVGPGAPVAAPPAPMSNHIPDLWQKWSVPPSGRPDRGSSRKVIVLIVVGLALLGLVVGLIRWTGTGNSLTGGGLSHIAVDDCLASEGERLVAVVGCADAGADFLVVGRYSGTTDAGQCSATPSDVVVVSGGPTVLCLDYVAAVGDCLFAGDLASQVGKVSCESTLPGVYRVAAVLHNSIDPNGCPSGTTQTLVHLHNAEVLCLAKA